MSCNMRRERGSKESEGQMGNDDKNRGRIVDMDMTGLWIGKRSTNWIPSFYFKCNWSNFFFFFWCPPSTLWTFYSLNHHNFWNSLSQQTRERESQLHVHFTEHPVSIHSLLSFDFTPHLLQPGVQVLASLSPPPMWGGGGEHLTFSSPHSESRAMKSRDPRECSYLHVRVIIHDWKHVSRSSS